MLEQIKDSLHKKIDNEYFQTVSNKIKSDCQSMLSTYQSEQSYARKHADEKQEERLAKSEMNAERALDELFFIREQLKQLQEERKRDIEETAEFIKQVINNGKQEQQRELQKIG